MSIASAQVESYYETSTLDNLRRRARRDPEKALEEVARQFESIFTRMMLKSMRDANFGNPLFDSDSGKFYQDMYDDQLAMDLAKNGSIGLADILVKQLSGSPVSRVSYNQHSSFSRYKADEKPSEILAKPLQVDINNRLPSPYERGVASHTDSKIDVRDEFEFKKYQVTTNIAGNTGNQIELGTPKKFVQSLWVYAERAGKELGVQPQALLAQAALETGWGKYVINNKDEKNSHNLFNIKADKRWGGDSVTKITLEYESGIAKKEQAKFRSYDSFAESFSDYVSFIKTSPRYQNALNASGNSAAYFSELQRAGYATDPHYAGKIQRIMNAKPMLEAVQETVQEAMTQLPTTKIAKIDGLSAQAH